MFLLQKMHNNLSSLDGLSQGTQTVNMSPGIAINPNPLPGFTFTPREIPLFRDSQRHRGPMETKLTMHPSHVRTGRRGKDEIRGWEKYHSNVY